MLTNIVKFFGLLFLMYLLSFIPFGIYVNAGIVIYALWNLIK